MPRPDPVYSSGMVAIPNDPPKVTPDMNPITSRWQRLALMDRHSPDFLPLLLLLTTADRSLTTTLRGDDAKIALGALDEVRCPFAVVN